MRMLDRGSTLQIRLATAAVASLAVLVMAAAGDPPKSRSRKIDIPALIEMHNKARAKEKLGLLAVNDKLVAAARFQAKDMADRQVMTHEGTDGSNSTKRLKDQGYRFMMVGENVAMGQKSSTEVMTAWMNSPPHKENILKPDFTEIGLACYTTAEGVSFWCAVLAKPWPEIAPRKDAQAMLDAINAARAEAKAPPLKVDPKLELSAAKHAEAMSDAGKFLAKNPNGKTPFERAEREGYAAKRISQHHAIGQADAVKVVKSWIESGEESRSVILGAAYKDVGIGVATDQAGVPYWCVVVGQAKDAAKAKSSRW